MLDIATNVCECDPKSISLRVCYVHSELIPLGKKWIRHFPRNYRLTWFCKPEWKTVDAIENFETKNREDANGNYLNTFPENSLQFTECFSQYKAKETLKLDIFEGWFLYGRKRREHKLWWIKNDRPKSWKVNIGVNGEASIWEHATQSRNYPEASSDSSFLLTSGIWREWRWTEPV